jgi:uncharacterized repeat protein (TIGR01451 family)
MKVGGSVLRTVAAALCTAGVALALGAGTAQAFTQSDFVSFTLEGCRNNGSISLPNGSGQFICPDAAYTTGNLGKGWNELDLVPHRLTTTSGNQSNATTDYDVYVAADYQTSGHLGYDVISVPTVNPVSDASCTVSAGPQATDGSAQNPFGGGTDVVIYRQLTIHQAKNTTCVFDYFQRLALGSHLYPGSSLQSYMFDQVGLTGSKKTISIPVNQILPQSVSKDMSASQGTDHVWDVTKGPNNAVLDFGNTCSVDPSALKKGLQITVTWTKQAATPDGPITVITHVYATNPAARTITTSVTDVIYSGTTALDSSSATADIPANTTQLILTHTFLAPDGTTDLNDIATATYTDKATGIPVPGSTTAKASAIVQLNGPEQDASAVINDVEVISGTGLTFSTDSFSGASGAFDNGYAAGTTSTGPVSWTSASQSGSGQVVFDKTVYVTKGSAVTGDLSDTATVTGSSSFTAQATADVKLQSEATVSLIIGKTIDNVLEGSDTASFTFHVTDSSNTEVTGSPVTISFTAGQTSNSVTISGLAPGTYTVSEDAAGGWFTPAPKTTTISLPACSGEVDFSNQINPATARVRKVSVPGGFEANWTFSLNGPGGPVTATTSGTGFVTFGLGLKEGSYTITETPQDGWESDGGSSGCSFTVDYPADAGKEFDCTFTNTFQPTITLDKTGDALGKIGDPVHYTITLKNTSPSGGAAGTPTLSCTLVDTLVGINETVSLAPGGTVSRTPTYTVKAGDPDPLVNTVTADCTYVGLAQPVHAQATASTNLFQPGVKLTKTGSSLAKIGDTVTYNITILNTSSADSPNLVFNSFTDSVVSGVTPPAACSPLAPGASCSFSYTYVVKTTDPDPLLNTATVHYHPDGFPNDITSSDRWSLNLFQPSVKITKTGPAFSKAGDTATYNVTIQNTSSADTPNLVLASFSDSKVAGVTPPASCSPLAPGASCTFSYNYVVQVGDPDPLVNTATVHYNPTGSTSDVTSYSSWTTDLLHPSFTVAKACKAGTEPIAQAGPAIFTITFNNTGDAALHVVPSEGSAFDVAAGASGSYDYSVNGPFSATVNNTVTGTVTLAPAYNLTNSYPLTASGSCTVQGKANVVKTVSGQPPAADQTFTFQLRQGASTVSDGTILETDTTDTSGNISFSTPLVPGQTYQVCEWVMPGWNTNLAGDGPLFVPNSIVPPSLPNPNVNNMTVCANFTVTSGQTRTFSVDNTPPPGGRALTIGFWKNWASCSSSNGKGQTPMLDLALGIASASTTNPPGGLVVSAQNAGAGWPNFAPTWYLVLKGNPASTADNILAAPSCTYAVNLLNKTTVDGKTKKASDPVFNMTAQLVGAELNRFMGAGINGTTITNINRAVLLDGKYAFNGLTYSPKLTTADTNLANCLATQLDNYNNDRPVSSCP